MESTMGTDFAKSVLRTIEVYNRYRSPEVTAKLVELERDSFTVEFEGSFCQSCGVQDYFEDFIHELEAVSGFEVEIDEIEQISPRSFKVQYVSKGASTGGKVDEEALFQEFLQERGLSIKEYLAFNPCTKDITRFHFRTWLFEKNSKKKRARVHARFGKQSF